MLKKNIAKTALSDEVGLLVVFSSSVQLWSTRVEVSEFRQGWWVWYCVEFGSVGFVMIYILIPMW